MKHIYKLLTFMWTEIRNSVKKESSIIQSLRKYRINNQAPGRIVKKNTNTLKLTSE